MIELYIALFAIGAGVLLLSLLSKPIEHTIISPPLAMAALGILFGPLALDLLHPERWGDHHRILEEAARLTLAIALMGIALRLPAGFMQTHWRSLAILLGLGMPLMCLVSAALAYAWLEVPVLVALLIGAVATPTDPVTASTVATGSVAQRNLPDRIRHTLSAESGTNDGLAYPLVLLPILLLTRPGGEAIGEWLVHTVLREVGGAIVLGIALGLAAGYCLRKAERYRSMEVSSFLAYTLALSLLALGTAKLVQAEPLLTVFVTGVAFDQLVGGSDRAQEENVQEAVNSFFTLPVFALFGLMLPWKAWLALGWPAVWLALSILALRRLPALLAIGRMMPALPERRDRWFLGWFGPLGVAALLYAMLAVDRTGEEVVWTVSSLVVFASLIAHGVTAAPLAKRYGRSG